MATYQTRSFPHTRVEAYQLAPYEESEPDEFFAWAEQHRLEYESGRYEELIIFNWDYNRTTDEEERLPLSVFPGPFIVKYPNPLLGFCGMHAENFHLHYELVPTNV